MAGRDGQHVETGLWPSQDTLAGLGWFDERRLVALRLDEAQWQTFQEAVLRAAAEPGATADSAADHSPENLLTRCLRQWLQTKG